MECSLADAVEAVYSAEYTERDSLLHRTDY